MRRTRDVDITVMSHLVVGLAGSRFGSEVDNQIRPALFYNGRYSLGVTYVTTDEPASFTENRRDGETAMNLRMEVVEDNNLGANIRDKPSQP
jgi:hypothetical protein